MVSGLEHFRTPRRLESCPQQLLQVKCASKPSRLLRADTLCDCEVKRVSNASQMVPNRLPRTGLGGERQQPGAYLLDLVRCRPHSLFHTLCFAQRRNAIVAVGSDAFLCWPRWPQRSHSPLPTYATSNDAIVKWSLSPVPETCRPSPRKLSLQETVIA